MSSVKKPTASRQSLIQPKMVDKIVNAAFAAFTRDLDRPFNPGGRNTRSIVRQWCPLLQEVPPDMDVESFRSAYLSAHFFDRYFYAAEGGVHRSLEDQALEKFQKNLGRGKVMNDWKLEFLPFGKLNSILQSASLEVARILGDFDTEKFFELCTHGPNSTIGVKKIDAYLDRKFAAWDGTLSAHHMFAEYLEWNSTFKEYFASLSPEEISRRTIVVTGNRLSFVPKKFDSLRTMMVEPTLNQFFQQGLGKYIAERLFHAGVDLETQPYCHGKLVSKITTESLSLATIDWSQASDRIWLKLCQRLLPSDWFAAFEDVRSPSCSYRGQEFTLTMMGSMGCGFTFSLQTLLFLCLLRALARESGKEQFVTVFGDDCICDSDLKEEVEWLAEQLDWKLNSDKSFWCGQFRESCGVDSYRGTDCRPFFIERPDDTSTKAAIAAWLYGCYNGMTHRTIGRSTLAKDQWLIDTFSELDLGDIFIVPFRFSDRAGVRVKHPSRTIGSVSSSVIGSDAEGWKFRFIANKRKRVVVDPEPYYLWTLAGKGIPQDFKKGHIDPLEDTLPEPDKQSRVPWKGSCYGSKAGYVHTWHYFTD